MKGMAEVPVRAGRFVLPTVTNVSKAQCRCQNEQSVYRLATPSQPCLDQIQMSSDESFRFKAHHHLLEIDAATTHLMMLVVAREVTGLRWDEAVTRQKQAYESWAAALVGIPIDPMPPFDARVFDPDFPAAD